MCAAPALSGQSILGGRTVVGRVPAADTGEVGNVPSPPGAIKHHEIVIVGGGSAGATAAACLCRTHTHPDVAVIEPLETHDYQPLWTLVGGGVVPKERSRHHEIDALPRN